MDSWIADSFNVNTWVLLPFLVARRSYTINYRWMIVSSMVQLGLSWWQAWICVWLGYGVVAPFICLNARPGAIFHVTFPVVARTSFGLYGSLWCTFNRGAMAWCVVISMIVIWNYVYLITNPIPQYLVWCASQYRWRLHEGHAPGNLAKCEWYTCVICTKLFR